MQVIGNLVITKNGIRIAVEKINYYHSDGMDDEQGVEGSVCVHVGHGRLKDKNSIEDWDAAVEQAWRNAQGITPTRTPRKKYSARELVAQFVEENLRCVGGGRVNKKIVADLFRVWCISNTHGGGIGFSDELLELLIGQFYKQEVDVLAGVERYVGIELK
jgi:hypothetical protein